MTITTVRPTGLPGYDECGNGLGAGTHLVRLSDGSDTTSLINTLTGFFVREQPSFSGAFTLPGGAYIRQVRLAVRYGKRAGTHGSYISLQDIQAPYNSGQGTFAVYAVSIAPSDIALHTLYTGWSDHCIVYPGGTAAPWTQAAVNALILHIPISNSTANDDVVDLYDAWVEVDVNTPPTVTVSTPTGTVTSTTRPQVGFTFNDADSDNMIGYRYKIFSAAQYGAGGFDPATSTATYDSGPLTGSIIAGGTFTGTAPTADLVNGTTYKYYMLVQQDTDGTWSTTWTAGPAFTITITAPAQPIVTATVDNANARISVTVQGNDNLLTKDQASVETGVTGWAAVTNCAIAQDATQFLDGSKSLRLTSTAGGDMSARTTPIGTSAFPVTVGQTYEALASFKSAVSVRSTRIDIFWLDASGAALSSTAGTAGNDATGAWNQRVAQGVAPASAAFAYVQVTVLATGAGAEVHYVDCVSFAPGTSTAWARGGFVDANYLFYIEYSDDGGTTWLGRRESPLNPGTDELYVLQDYEATPNLARSYRARASGVDSSLRLTGINSATSTATSVPTTTTGWLLKDPLDPTKNIQIDVYSATWDIQEQEEQAVYNPLGRQFPVVVADVIHGRDGTLEMEFTSRAAYEAFHTLRDTQHVMLLQRVYAAAMDQKYIRLGKVSKDKEHNTTPTLFEVTIDYVEIDAP
jgi:hypothetical protein